MRCARTTCRAALFVITSFTRLGVAVMPKPDSIRGCRMTANAFLMKEPHEEETSHGATISQASVVNSPTNWKDLGRGLGYPIYKFARANHGNHNHL
jgi:hypothetical protein